MILYSVGRQAKQAYTYFEYNPVKLADFAPGLLSSSFTYVFDIHNPTEAQATISSIYGQVWAGGKQIGTFSVSNPIVIAARKDTQVRARVTLTNLSVLTLLVAAAKAGKTPDLKLTGDVGTALLGALPFDYTVLVQKDFSLKKKGS